MRLFALLALSVCVVAFVGCNAEEKKDDKKKDAKTNVSASIVPLCSACGEEADSENCCKEGVETCDCGFHKGTELCCNKGGIKPTSEKGTYCTCGSLKGSETCCKSEEMCGCGYAHGSEMCTAKCGDHEGKGHDDDKGHDEDKHDG